MEIHTHNRGGFQASSGTDLSLLLSSDSQDRATALDLPLDLTFFPTVGAKSKTEKRLTLRQLQALLSGITAQGKSDLPLIKLATFGDVPTIKGSLRHDANLKAVTGLEGDYDAGEIGPKEAADRLRQGGVAALIYTTPSHTAEQPRWRVLAPLAKAIPPSDRQALCARLNGALGGILAAESFTTSQSYFFGSVPGRPLEVILVDGMHLDRVYSVIPIAPPPKHEKIDGAGSTSSLPVTDAFVEAVLDHIPNDIALADLPATDRLNQGYTGLFSQVAFALWRQYRDDLDRGKALFHDWAGRNPDYKRKVVEDRWRGLNDKSSGGHFTLWGLIQIAEHHGFKRDDYAYDWGDDFDDLPPARPVTDLSALLCVTPAVVKPSRLTFLSPTDCKAAPSRGYLIKGLFAPYDVGCIFGAPGAGKSLLAPFLGYAVAQGREVFGMRSKAGGVFYVAAEDPMGMRGRVRSLESAHGDAPDFKLVEGVSNLLVQDSPDLAALVEVVKVERPALIFIDTLAMAFPGLEENDAKAMGRVVAVARHLSRWGAAVILIHHDTKAEGATPRGHSLLNGALDVALHVKRDEGGIIRGKLTKNRNGTCDRDIAFCIATEDGGTDEDGDVITLPRCNALIGAPSKVKGLPPQAAAALKILKGMSQPVNRDEWKSACMAADTVCSNEKPDTRRKAFDRALETLSRDEWIISHAGFYSICTGFDDQDGHGQTPDISDMSSKDNGRGGQDGQGHTP